MERAKRAKVKGKSMTLRGCQRQKYPACQEGIGKGKELDAKRVSTTEVPGLWWLTSQGDRQSDPRGKAQVVGQHSTEGHHKLWYYFRTLSLFVEGKFHELN